MTKNHAPSEINPKNIVKPRCGMALLLTVLCVLSAVRPATTWKSQGAGVRGVGLMDARPVKCSARVYRLWTSAELASMANVDRRCCAGLPWRPLQSPPQGTPLWWAAATNDWGPQSAPVSPLSPLPPNGPFTGPARAVAGLNGPHKGASARRWSLPLLRAGVSDTCGEASRGRGAAESPGDERGEIGCDRPRGQTSRGLPGAQDARSPAWGTQLEQRLRATQNLDDLLTLVETHHPAAAVSGRDGSAVEKEDRERTPGAASAAPARCMTWREAAVAMNRIELLSRAAIQARPGPDTAAAHHSSAIHRATPPSGTAAQERAQRAMLALATLISDELLSAATSARRQPQHAVARIGAERQDGKLLALSLSAAEPYNGTLPFLHAASALLSQDAFLTALFSRPGNKLSERQRIRETPIRETPISVSAQERQVDVGALATVMGVLSRRGRGSLASASLMAKLDQLILQVLPAHVTRSSSVSTQLGGAGDFGAFGGAGSGVTTPQLLSLLSLLCAGAGGANGLRPQQQAAMLHMANLVTLLPPHTFNPSSCATLLNFLLSQGLPTALHTRKWDKDIYSRVHDHVLKALWAIPPERLVPRNRAAVAALSSCIASLAKLSRPPDAPGDKKLLIQLSTAVMEGRRSWLITPQVLATLANSQSKAGVRDVPVLRSIALAVRMSPRADIEARHCALLLNAFAQLSLVDVPLFTLLGERLLEVQHRGHTLQSLSMALHALATLGPDALAPELHCQVVAQLYGAVRQVPTEKLHPLLFNYYYCCCCYCILMLLLLFRCQ